MKQSEKNRILSIQRELKELKKIDIPHNLFLADNLLRLVSLCDESSLDEISIEVERYKVLPKHIEALENELLSAASRCYQDNDPSVLDILDITLIDSTSSIVDLLKNRKRERHRKIILVIFGMLSFICISLLFVFRVIIPENKYQTAINYENEKNYGSAIDIFHELGEYKDSKSHLSACEEGKTYQLYENSIESYDDGEFEKAKSSFEQLLGYKDSDDYIKKCIYGMASDCLMNKDYESAKHFYSQIEGFMDAESKMQECISAQAYDYYLKGEFDKAIELYESMVANEETGQMISLCKAEKLLSEGKQKVALGILSELGEYKEADKKVTEIKEDLYTHAIEKMDAGSYSSAYDEFKFLEDYRDSIAKKEECGNMVDYEAAINLFNNANYDGALQSFKNISNFEDSAQYIDKCNSIIYEEAKTLQEQGNYADAIERYSKIRNYLDSSQQINGIIYEEAKLLQKQGNYADAIENYSKIPNYLDSSQQITACAKHFVGPIPFEKLYGLETLEDVKKTYPKIKEDRYSTDYIVEDFKLLPCIGELALTFNSDKRLEKACWTGMYYRDDTFAKYLLPEFERLYGKPDNVVTTDGGFTTWEWKSKRLTVTGSKDILWVKWDSY